MHRNPGHGVRLYQLHSRGGPPPPPTLDCSTPLHERELSLSHYSISASLRPYQMYVTTKPPESFTHHTYLHQPYPAPPQAPNLHLSCLAPCQSPPCCAPGLQTRCSPMATLHTSWPVIPTHTWDLSMQCLTAQFSTSNTSEPTKGKQKIRLCLCRRLSGTGVSRSLHEHHFLLRDYQLIMTTRNVEPDR